MDVGVICDIIIKGCYRNVSIQFPESDISEVSGIICTIQEALESKKCDSKIYFLGDVTSGDCCVDRIAAKRCSSDLIIHFGHWCHTPYVIDKCFIYHSYSNQSLDVNIILNHIKEIGKYDSILLLYDTCFHHLLDEFIKIGDSIANVNVYKCVEDISQTNGHNVRFGRIPHKNIDGCGVSMMIFLGRLDCIDRNYPLLYRIALEIESGTRLDCLYSNGLITENLNLKSKITSKRYSLIEKIKDATRIGICTGTSSLYLSNELRNMLNKIVTRSGRECYTFIVGKVNAEKLDNFPKVDVFCFLLCPEQILKYIDENDISQKILNRKIVFPFELLVAFGVIEWSDEYIFDFKKLLEICQDNKSDSKAELANMDSRELANLSTSLYNTLINNNERTYKGLDSEYNCNSIPTITPGLYGTSTSYKSVDSNDNYIK